MLRKKIYLTALLAALLTLLAIWWYRAQPSKISPYAAIPSETAIVLDFNPIGKDGQPRLPRVPGYHGLYFFMENWTDAVQSQVHLARQLMQHDGPLYQAFQTCRLLAALTLRPDEEPLYVLELGETPVSLRALATDLREKRFHAVSPRQFRSDTLWFFPKKTPGESDFTFAQKNGLLLFSCSTVLVEDALARLDAGDNWWPRCPFVQKAAEPAEPFRLLIRADVLAQRLSAQMLPSVKHLPALLAKQIEWLGLAWDGNRFRVALSPTGWLRQMPDWGQSPSAAMLAVLPAHTALALRAGFAEPSVFFKKIGAEVQPDWTQHIEPWWGRDAAFVLTQPLTGNLSEHQFVVLSARDTAEASARLAAYGRHRGLLKNYDYQTFVLRQFAEGDLLRPLVGEQSAFQNAACAVVGDHVVFAVSTAALERWIDQYIVGETLSANADFLQMAQSLPAESGASVLLNLAALPVLAPSLWPTDRVLSVEPRLQALATLGWLGADLRRSANGYWLEAHLARSPASAAPADPQTALVWKTALAADAATAPSIVDTDWEEGSVSIFVQDVRHQLYRLGRDGKLRWRRQLPGPMLSGVQSIDFFYNQTSCYFFNTPDALWLLDENGRDVEGFPLKLRSPAVNAALAVPMDEGCAFFVALKNGNVQGFNQLGQPLDGWNPQRIGSEVAASVLHFYYDDGDYLAVLTRGGRLSVFAKNGQLRFPPVQFEGQFSGAMQVNKAAPLPCIVCFNERGQAFACDVRGRSLRLSLGPTDEAGVLSGFGTVDYGPDFEYAALGARTLTYGEYDNEEHQYRRVFSKKYDRTADAVFVPQSGCAGVLHRRMRRAELHWQDGRAEAFEGSTVFRLLPVSEQKYLLVTGNGPSVCGYAVARW